MESAVHDFVPVQITRDLPPCLEAPTGYSSNFTLECNATGFPRPSFQWFKLSNSETWEELSKQNSNILNIKPVSYEDGGDYICRVSNRNPRTKEPSVKFTKQFSLIVIFEPLKNVPDTKSDKIAPPVIKLHPRLPGRGPVEMGLNLIFECQAKGEPPISYEWFKNGNIVRAGTDMCSIEEEKSILKIDNIQPENNVSKFTIQCQAVNPGGVTMSEEYKFSLGLGPSANFQAKDKVALLIGNGSYGKDDKLPNVQKDIIDLANALKSMDFNVLTLQNLEKHEIYNAVDMFCQLLDTDVYGVFYFVGHGFQSRLRDYMVPISSQEELKLEDSICVDYVGKRMQQRNPALRCLIIDTCRNDFGVDSFDQEEEPLRSVQDGRNRIYVYATTSYHSALDGRSGENGLFMKHLLKSISLSKPLKEVLDRVMADIGLDDLASNNQIPEVSTTLVRPLSLRDDIMSKDLDERNARFKYLQDVTSHRFDVPFQNERINIVVERYEQVIDNVVDVKLWVNHSSLNTKYTAYVERIKTSDVEKVEFDQLFRTTGQQRYVQVIIYNMQKIKGQLTMDVVPCWDSKQYPSICVRLDPPSISRACLWRKQSQLEDPPESGFLSCSSCVSH